MMIYATPNQLCATPQRGATLKGLCAPPLLSLRPP